MEYKKKLIEVALPLEAINEASAYEKMPGIGPHPRGIHLWWARRPLAAARAVIWSSLVDDPSSHPDQFPTEEAQNQERQRLFAILEKLVKWKNSNDPEILAEAKAEIMKSTCGNPPALLDPFAGGGAIPLEAQRLGLEAHASDLNPVAVMINKAMIEIPPKFAGQPPVNPNSNLIGGMWAGVTGLAEDVRYYGEWMKNEAFKRIGHLYPKVKDEHGQTHTVIAWIWARTVKCPNPACGCEMPLIHSFEIAKKKGKTVYLSPVFEDKKVRFTIKDGKNKDDGTVNRKGASCIKCGTPVGFPYIRDEGKAKRMKKQLIAIVAEGRKGRIYIEANDEHVFAAEVQKPSEYPDAQLPYNPRNFNTAIYGLENFSELFTNRQLVALSTFSDLLSDTLKKIIDDAKTSDIEDDQLSLSDGGKGALAYAQAICTYLAFAVSSVALKLILKSQMR